MSTKNRYGPAGKHRHTTQNFRGHSSVERAPALQAGGRRFESDWLHQDLIVKSGVLDPSSTE